MPTRPLKLRYCGYRSWIDLYDRRYDIVDIVSFFNLTTGRCCCIHTLGHKLRIHNTAFRINEYESGNEYYY